MVPLKTLAGVLAALGLAKLTKDTISSAQNMARLRLAFTAAAGGAKEGAAEFEFVRQQSKRLGFEVTGTADSYKGLLAATVAAGKRTDDARLIFLGVSEAARAMRLSNDDARGTMLAITQIMSKGKVTAEELRQQLGERFPVAMGLMSQALGVTTQELDKMLEQGEITADALLPFAEKLREKFGGQLAGAMNGSTAAMNRLRNDATELADKIGKNGLLDAVTITANAVRKLFRRFVESDAPKRIGEAFRTLAEKMREVAERWGPKLVEMFTKVVNFMANGVGPAFDKLRSVAEKVIISIGAGFRQLQANIATVVSGIAKTVAFLAEKGAQAAAVLADEEGAKQLQAAAVAARNLAKDMDKVKASAINTRDKWLDMLLEANKGTKQTATETGLTAAQVRNLGKEFRVTGGITGGKAEIAYEQMSDGLDKPKAAIKDTTDEVKKLASAYDTLKQK